MTARVAMTDLSQSWKIEAKFVYQNSFRLAIAIFLTIPFSGCIWPFHRTPKIESPIVFQAPPSAPQLAEAVNANSSRVHQLESQVKLKFAGMPGLTGNLALEKPNNFRVQASILGVGGLGADIGSNDESFWIWIKTALPGQTPMFLYARHAEFAVSQTRQQIPIDPSWIRDALGLTEIDPYGGLEGPYERPDGQLEIRYTRQTPAGPNMHVAVIDRKYAWITEQSIYDAQGILLVTAKSSKHRYYQETNVNLPHRIEISLVPNTPDARELVIDIASHNINRISGNPDYLWSMPEPSGVQYIDLAGPLPVVENQPFANTPFSSSPYSPEPQPPYPGRSDQAYRPNYRGRDLR